MKLSKTSEESIITGFRLELLPLTSLRFFSALWVFLFHINLRWSLELPLVFSNIISQGPLGMSLFFILSGFVLTYTYFGKEPVANYQSFLIKRLARIYPVYILVSLLTVQFFVIPNTGVDQSNVIIHFFSYFVVIFLNVFLLQAWFPSIFNYWINGGTWSLSVEFFFYTLFPNILSLLKELSSKQLKITLLILYCLSFMPSLVFVLPFEPKVTLSTVYALPIYRLSEFIIGIIAAIVFVRNKDAYKNKNKYNYILLFSFFLLMIYTMLFANSFPQIYVIHNFIAIPLMATIIFSCASISTGIIYKFLSNQYFCYLGKLSYSFYLVQSIPILFVQNNYKKLTENFPFLLNNYLLALLIFSCSLLMSLVIYLLIETPARKLIIKLIK